MQSRGKAGEMGRNNGDVAAQPTSTIHIGTELGPAVSPTVPPASPSCRQTTCASTDENEWSHTEPQVPSRKTSSRPALPSPSTSRTAGVREDGVGVGGGVGAAGPRQITQPECVTDWSLNHVKVVPALIGTPQGGPDVPENVAVPMVM